MMCNKMTCRFISEDCVLGFSVDQNCYKPAKRSIEDIEQLKENWLEDPCRDIETTSGFEYHKEELLQYRFECEKLWKKEQERENEERKKRVRESASRLGIQDINLYKLVLKQIETIERLESAICSLCNQEFTQAWRILHYREY